MVVLTSCVTFLILTTSICVANLRTFTAQFIKGTAVTTSHQTIQAFSEIQCVRKCIEERKKDMCSVAEYNMTSKVCYLSNDSQEDVVDVADDMAGVFFMNGGEYYT